MTLTDRPWRSVLYIPGSNPRAIDKARGLACDGVILDLEDAVAPSEKHAARETLVAELQTGGFGPRARLVRVNGLDTDWGRDDLSALTDVPMDGLVLPKVSGPADISAAAAALPGVPLWAMMESPAAIASAYAIAASPGLAGLIVGTNDLLKDLGARHRADRLPLMLALQTCLMAARGAGLVCLDGVYTAFRESEGLAAECRQGRELGFDGKTLIHPAQIEIANATFRPSEAEIELAERQIAAFEAAQAAGQGVAVVDGAIVENLHAVTARALLARAQAITERHA